MEKQVAVIGDGINDVNSFKVADVRFASQSSCSFIKSKASMILLNDDFGGCICSIMWGRNIYSNIKRYLQFQMTANFSVFATVFLGYFYLTESPISPV